MGLYLSLVKSYVDRKWDMAQDIPWDQMDIPMDLSVGVFMRYSMDTMGSPMGSDGSSHGPFRRSFMRYSTDPVGSPLGHPVGALGSHKYPHRILVDPTGSPTETAICPMGNPMGCPMITHGMCDASYRKSHGQSHGRWKFP